MRLNDEAEFSDTPGIRRDQSRDETVSASESLLPGCRRRGFHTAVFEEFTKG